MGAVSPQDEEAEGAHDVRRVQDEERGEEEDDAEEGYAEEDIEGGEVEEADAPSDFTKLRACIPCKLVKTLNQFLATGCENCPFLDMANDSERVKDCTTPYFQGMISLINPKESWAGKWLRLNRRAAGCYAVRLIAELPEHIEDILRDNGVPYNPDE